MARNRKFYLFIAFGIGFTALIYEIYITRILFLFIIETSHALTIAISAFLAGLAFSSLAISKIVKTDDNRENERIIFWLELVVAGYAWFILRRYDLIPAVIDGLKPLLNSQFLIQAIKLSFFWLYLFIPALFIGGCFPLVNGLYLKNKDENTRDTGLVYFFDTIGSVFGAFTAGFILMPYFGLETTVLIALSTNICLAVIITKNRRVKIILLFIIISIIGYSLYNMRATQDNSPTLKDYPSLANKFGKILFREQSPFGLITVGQKIVNDKISKRLFINYRAMCGTDINESEIKISTLTAHEIPINSRVLNIGLGCGFTAREIAGSNKIKWLDIAEINPVVAHASRLHFSDENNNVLNMPKTQLTIVDGFEFLRETKNTYDAIIVDVEEFSIIYSSPMYTKDFFELAKQKMRTGGIFALWAYSTNDQSQKVIYNTLKSVFENVVPRYVDDFFIFLASDKKISPRTMSPEEAKKINTMLQNPVKDINTIDNRIIEKYYDIRLNLQLPRDYTEQFLR